MNQPPKLPESIVASTRKPESVRTTLRLSLEATSDLEWLAKQWARPKKAVLDSLPKIAPVLEKLGQLPNESDKPDDSWVRSSYVLDARTVRELNSISKKLSTTRDVLVTYGLRCVRALVELEAESYPDRLEEADGIISKGYKILEDVEREVTELLGPNDPVTIAVGYGRTAFEMETREKLDEQLEEATSSREEIAKQKKRQS